MDSRRGRWGEWSNWEWDAAQARYWRARRDAQGNIEYGFYKLPPPAQAAPRINVDDLAESMSTVDLGGQDTSYTQGGAYTYGAPITADGGAASTGAYSAPSAQAKGKGRAAEPPGRHRPKPQYRPTGKDKSSFPKKPRPKYGKFSSDNYTDDDAAASDFDLGPFYSRSAPPDPTSEEASPSAAAGSPRQGFNEPTSEPSPHDSAYASARSHVSNTGHLYGQGPSSLRDTVPEPVDTGRHVRRGYDSEDEPTELKKGNYRTTGDAVTRDNTSDPLDDAVAGGGPSHRLDDAAARDGPRSQLDDAISQADPYMTGALGDTYSTDQPAWVAVDPGYPQYSTVEDDDGRATPRASAQPVASTTVAGDYSYQTNPPRRQYVSPEPNDDDGYVLEHSSKFRPGAVFKIVWCEPRGAMTNRKSEIITNQVRMEHDGRQFYQGIRRFIVVANDEGHCACVPILTYEHKACTKKGVKPLKHGIVYQSGKRPRMVDGEPQLGFPPIRVDLHEKTEKLDRESRVNYAKITTVEHNFKVFFIGRVDDHDFDKIVIPAVDHCWSRKQRSYH